MKNLLKYSVAVLIVVVSCKKDPEITTPPKSQITISNSSSDMKITDINPDTTLTSDGQKTIYAIDIDADGTADFNLRVDNDYDCGGMVLNLSDIRLQSLNSNSYVLADSILPDVLSDQNHVIISQTMVDSIYPKVLSVGDVVYAHSKWRQGVFMLSKSSGGSGCPPSGPPTYWHQGYWYTAGEKYIGIRYRNSLGWIKINVADVDLKVYEFAISK